MIICSGNLIFSDLVKPVDEKSTLTNATKLYVSLDYLITMKWINY